MYLLTRDTPWFCTQNYKCSPHHPLNFTHNGIAMNNPWSFPHDCDTLMKQTPPQQPRAHTNAHINAIFSHKKTENTPHSRSYNLRYPTAPYPVPNYGKWTVHNCVTPRFCLSLSNSHRSGSLVKGFIHPNPLLLLGIKLLIYRLQTTARDLTMHSVENPIIPSAQPPPPPPSPPPTGGHCSCFARAVESTVSARKEQPRQVDEFEKSFSEIFYEIFIHIPHQREAASLKFLAKNPRVQN